jgi:hypothetical protein
MKRKPVISVHQRPLAFPSSVFLWVLGVSPSRFASASDYIAVLVEAARKQKSEIEAALLEGLASGPAEDQVRRIARGLPSSRRRQRCAFRLS